jgi:hypothetical protein
MRCSRYHPISAGALGRSLSIPRVRNPRISISVICPADIIQGVRYVSIGAVVVARRIRQSSCIYSAAHWLAKGSTEYVYVDPAWEIAVRLLPAPGLHLFGCTATL